jgi:hypothetical protein
MSELEQLQQKVDDYESILGIGENDVAKEAFYSLCRIARQQTKRLDKFELDKEIGQNPKEDKVYDRVMEIVVKMPKMISDIHALRKELGITNKQIEEAFVDGIAEKRY